MASSSTTRDLRSAVSVSTAGICSSDLGGTDDVLPEIAMKWLRIWQRDSLESVDFVCFSAIIINLLIPYNPKIGNRQ